MLSIADCMATKEKGEYLFFRPQVEEEENFNRPFPTSRIKSRGEEKNKTNERGLGTKAILPIYHVDNVFPVKI